MDKRLEQIKSYIETGKIFDAVYSSMWTVFIKMPECQIDILEMMKTAVRSDKNSDVSLCHAIRYIGHMFNEAPEHCGKIFEVMKVTLQSDKIEADNLYEAIDIIGRMFDASPKHRNEILEVMNVIVQSDKNDHFSLENAFGTMGRMFDALPEHRGEVLEMMKTTVQSDKNKAANLRADFKIMGKMFDASPEHRGEILEMMKAIVQSDKNSAISLQNEISVMEKMFTVSPEHRGEILEMMKAIVQSDKNNYNSLFSAMSVMGRMFDASPDHRGEIFEMMKIAVQSDENGVYSLTAAIKVLGKMSEASPEYRGEILDIVLSSEIAENDKDKFRVAAACLKQMKPEEVRAQYPDQAELIDAAYKARFCDEKEKDFLLDHYSLKDIGQMNLSAQQRCKNILVGMLAQENELEPAKNWRTDEASVKLYQDNQDWIIPASFKAEQIFGCYFPSYMKQTVPYFGVHDSVSWLPADLTPKSAETFRSFIGNNIIYATQDGEKHARPMNELMIISKNWNSLKPEEQKGKYKDVLSICMSRKYKDQTCDAFAAEAAKHGVPEYKYKNCEDIYLSGLGVPEPFDSSKTYQFGKYTGRFVTRDDVRTGFFGDYTNCCQHFGGVGDACAVSTVKDPYSQLFVIEDDKGRIIAGSWAWENKEGKYRDVCFDNIEAIGEDSRTEMLNRIYEMAAKDLCETQNCHKVTIGLGYQDADTSKYQQTEAIALPEQYHNKYSDARSQVLLRENPEAQPLDKTQESKRFIRAASFLDVNEMDNVSEKCFPDSDRALQTPDHVEGLVLVDEAKGIVGYCLYDSKEKDIYDMAVLPEYRKDKNGSSLKLLGETIKKVKEFGGEWSADLRDKTTLRFMEAMEKRGLVEMERKGVDHTMSDGSEVVKVSFRPVVPEQTKTKAPQQRPVGRGGR